MKSYWNGIYNAYMTGSDGQGFAMFVFYEGVIAGSDATGTLFDGTYTEDESGTVAGTVRTSIPSGSTVIQGATAGSAGLMYDVPIQLSPADLEAEFITISTMLGPVNLKLEKIRTLGDLD